MQHSHASQKYQTEHAQVGEAIADQCVDGRDATRGEARQKDGFIGCEYKPRARTEDGLGWAKAYGVTPNRS